MGLKIKHKIYDKDFTTKEIYSNRIDEILEKIKDDKEEIKNKFHNANLEDMNSEIVGKIEKISEDLIDKYTKTIEDIEWIVK